MEANNGPNLQKKTETSHNSKNKNNIIAAGESLSCWKSTSKCIINMMEFLERAKSYAYLIKDGLFIDQELQKVEKRILSIFVVYKCLRKICHSIKDTVIKSLTSLGVKPRRIMWDILLL